MKSKIKKGLIALLLACTIFSTITPALPAFAVGSETGEESAATPDYAAYIGSKIVEVYGTDYNPAVFELYTKPNGMRWTYTVLTSGYDANGNYYNNVNVAEAFDLYVNDVQVDDAGVLWFYFEASKEIKDTLDGEPYTIELKQWLKADTVRLDRVINAADNTTVSVSGSLPKGVTVSAKAVSEDNVGKYEIKGEVVAALDIKLFDPDGNEVQPNTPVMVTLDASAWGLEDGSVVNIHHDHDGNVSVMSNYLILNGKLTFTVSDFSIFIVENVEDIGGTEEITAGRTYEMIVGESKVFYWARQNGNQNVDCVWYVEDPDGLINYEVTKSDYTNEQYTAPWITVNAIKASADDGSVATITLKYENNNNGVNQETFKIEVKNPDSNLYIDNQIPENGCLVPKLKEGISSDGVTYTWSRSSGVDAERKVILEEAYNEENGGVNVSIDSGGVINGRDPITYTVTAKDANGNVLGTAQYEVLYGSELLNTSFEYPDIDDPDILSGVYPGDEDTKFYVYNGYPGFYWKTTAPGTTTSNNNQRLTDDIEIIRAHGNKTEQYYQFNDDAADGNQFAEVNAENFGALYQDVLTTPGAEFTWAFSHRGRSNGGENTLFIVVAATKDAQTIQNATDIGAFLNAVKSDDEYGTIDSDGEGILVTYNGAQYRVWRHEGNTRNWDKISGTYKVPNDQYLTRLFFVSDTNNNDNNTMGNFIDAVSAGETLSYQIQYYVNGEPQPLTAVKRAQVHSNASETFPDSIDLNEYSITTVTANGITYPYDLNLNGRDYQLYITEYGTKEPGQAADIKFEIHLRSRAITVTKKVVIDGFDTLDADQRNVIIGHFSENFVANFTLNDTNNTLVSVVVSYIAETNEFIGTAEIDLTDAEDGTYIISETSCTDIPGYILTNTEFSGGMSSDESYSVTIDDNNPVVAITCTNTYTIGSADLTILKQYPEDADYSIDENQTFLFHVTGNDVDLFVTVHGNGSVTVKDLPIGNYTVTEKTDWSWRYAPDSVEKEVEVKAGADNAVTFTNTRSEKDDNPDTPDNWKWLDGNAWADNLFTGE